MNLRRHGQEWDEIAEEDPLWAILSSPDKEHGGWDIAEFFATGDVEIEGLLAHARTIGHPSRFERALDFGCGYGRLTRALAPSFDEVVGIDISARMIASATEFNAHVPGCRFMVNAAADLTVFDDGEFDLIYSNIVLQHVPTAEVIANYIAEFVRVLRPQGLGVFQLPTSIPWRYRLQPRRRAYAILRYVRVSPGFLRGRLHLHPIRMSSVSEADVLGILERAGAYVIEIQESSIDGYDIPSNTYWFSRK